MVPFKQHNIPAPGTESGTALQVDTESCEGALLSLSAVPGRGISANCRDG